jgi:hypothetical protein
MKYVVEFTENQLRVLATSLEFYSRFLAGQWEIPNEMQFNEFKLQEKYDGFWTKRNYVEEQLKILKSHFTGLQLNASYGIGSSALHESAKVAYDIYRPCLEVFNKDSDNVYSYPGLTYSKEGRIKIEVKDETDKER